MPKSLKCSDWPIQDWEGQKRRDEPEVELNLCQKDPNPERNRRLSLIPTQQRCSRDSSPCLKIGSVRDDARDHPYFCATLLPGVSKISFSTCPRICFGCSTP